MISRAKAGFFKVFREPPIAPALVLCLSFVGFGVLCEGLHLGLMPTLYTTVFVFALPGQVVLVDQIARGVPILTAALAVSFTAVRLLPMTVALMPHLQKGGRSRWLDYVMAHFVAVTMWIESMRRIPRLPRGMRPSYYFGLALILVGVSVTGTVAGYLLAGHLPRNLAGALIFLTPIYFFLGLISNTRSKRDYAPIALGFVGAPFFMKLAPSFDLVLTGVVGGSVAFLLRQLVAGGREEASVHIESGDAG